MKKNHLTLVIQSAGSATHSAKNTIQFSFHKRVILWFFLCIILMIFFGASGSRSIFKNLCLKQQIAALEESLSQRAYLEKKIADVRRDETRMRAFLGIEAGEETINIEDRLGMGGSDPEDDGDIESFDPIAELESLVDTRPLQVQVYSLREDLSALSSILLQRKETLRTRPMIMPVQDDEIWMTSGFGWRKSPFTGLRKYHSGIDISGRKGVPIIATADGEVSSVGFDRFLGNNVWIIHDDRFETTYGHMLKATVKKGEKVQRGQIIGLMGSSGRSTGYHVHYEVTDNGKKMNPFYFILNPDALKPGSSRG